MAYVFAGELKIAGRDVDAGDQLEQLREMSCHAARTAAEFEAMSLRELPIVAGKKIFQVRNGGAPGSNESRRPLWH